MGNVLSQRQKFCPSDPSKPYDDYKSVMVDVRKNANDLRRMRSFKLWLAFQLSRHQVRRNPVQFIHNGGTREDDIVLRIENFEMRRTASENYGKDGRLSGRLEFLVDAHSQITAHWLIKDSNEPREIDNLKLKVTKFHDLPKDEQDRLSRVHLGNNYTHFGYSTELYKVEVDEDGDVYVFKPETRRANAPQGQHVPNPTARADEIAFAKKIVGLPFLQPDNTFYNHGDQVLLFRRKKRSATITLPFAAAVWLEARANDVPVPLFDFFVIMFLFIGACVPFIVLVIPNQSIWDRFERVFYLSGFFLTALSVRELITYRGSSALNVSSGFIRPARLRQMASALGCIDVNQLLLLARMGGVWTNNLDQSSLCFLGTSREYRGDIRRDEWEPMNKYAVQNESFNKEFFFTGKAVMKISGSSAEKGGHCTRLYSERSQSFSSLSSFVNFNETQHYLAGYGPEVMYANPYSK